MGCSGAGLVAIVVLFVAVTLSVVSTVLPAWSTSTISTSTGKAEFGAGVWGYCTDLDMDAKGNTSSLASISFDHCFFFHTTNQFDVPGAVEDAAFMANFSSRSLCDGYDTAADESDAALAQYIEGLATLAGLDAGQFDKFLDRSCGPLGTTTLAFASLSIVAGVFAFLALLLGVTCCKNKSALIVVGKVLSGAAFALTLLTFLLWLAQAHSLTKKDDVNYSGAFILSVLAALLYLIVTTLAARHAALG